MKSVIAFITRLGPVLTISAAVFFVAVDSHSAEPSDLTVHEWGTFTSVAGEDGSAIDWDALGCKNDLPRFVNDYGYRGFKWRLQGTVRMETPVIYFYSSRELNAHVRVTFPQGLITEWYPQAKYAVYQKSGADGSMRLLAANLSGIDTCLRNLAGAIEWRDIKVQPGIAPTFPVENGGPNRYYAARGTDAAPITIGAQSEKFLFYRGVGRFSVPLSARVSSDGKIAVQNRSQEPIPNVILFENHDGRIAHSTASAIDDTITFGAPSLDGSLPQLLQDLESTLVEQGLFPKEAHAMLKTWQDSWFEEGARLIYILPSAAVDTILPLQVEPAPSQAVRVFVGRIELITPAIEGSAKSAIAQGDWSAIARYGRFVDPILKRIYAEDVGKVGEIEQSLRGCQGTVFTCNCR
jgi:hypothetical protein